MYHKASTYVTVCTIDELPSAAASSRKGQVPPIVPMIVWLSNDAGDSAASQSLVDSLPSSSMQAPRIPLVIAGRGGCGLRSAEPESRTI